MTMLPMLLLLSGLAALSTGAPKKDVPFCPNILCAAVVCENPKPTYLRFNGERCRGCDKCPRPVTVCPIRDCQDPGPCSVPYVTTFFRFKGKKCPGCLICPPGFGEYMVQQSDS